MFSVYVICAIVIAYFLGSLPTGYLAGRARGIDIRKEGSGNIGATNALRVLGPTLGILVLLIDLAKGVAACYVAIWIPRLWGGSGSELGANRELILMLVGGLGAVLGHSFTCWLGFKGGKGVATTGGVFLAVALKPALICLAIFVILVALTRYVSLASITAAICLPVMVYYFHRDIFLTALTLLVALLVVYRHRANIQRLLKGTELKIGGHKKSK
jgi:glycerol-3-phosphate acyltransferase PlsY